MDLQVPLNRLKFGHQDGQGINARVVGREEDIASLAVNLHAQGQIENLIVKDAGDGFYSVANGNRRLAAFHMLYTADSSQPINCTLHDVDEERAFQFSLTTAITAKQLHPVDQYEAFARLDERGKTHEEIAGQYGMSEKEVRQALALGRLSAKIRQAWRAGEIKAEVARAFTLGLDHKTQDKAFDKLKKDGRLYEGLVKKELGFDSGGADVVQLLDFVTAEAYRAAGGIVTEDLFGSCHIISDDKLLQHLARQRLIGECEKLVAAGWGWAEIKGDLPHGAQFWPQSQPKVMDWQGDEKERVEAARAKLQALGDDDGDYDFREEERLEREIEAIESAVRARSFDEAKRKKLGCIVDVEDGRLVVLTGIKKPVEARASLSGTDLDDALEAAAPTGKKTAAAAPAPEEPEISNALLQRLAVQLTKAAATALIQDEQLALSVLLAGFECMSDCGVRVSVSGLGDRKLLGADEMQKALPLASALQPAERVTLLAQVAANALNFAGTSFDWAAKHDVGPLIICNAIPPAAMNAALRGAFDAKDYFAGVNKQLVLKAIEEAMGADLARQQGKNPKSEIAAFALANVPKTGWLPPQLRAKGYDGPPVKAAKLTAPLPARGERSTRRSPKGEAGAGEGDSPRVPPPRQPLTPTLSPRRAGRGSAAAHAARPPKPAKKSTSPVKRAASAKKAAKKTTAKKRR